MTDTDMEAKAPREIICFCPIDLPSNKGDGYMFIAKDVYSHFLFRTGVDRENDGQTMLKHIGLLMKNESFKLFDEQPFLLILHDYEELADEINTIIESFGGRVVFDDPYVAQHMVEVIRHLYAN